MEGNGIESSRSMEDCLALARDLSSHGLLSLENRIAMKELIFRRDPDVQCVVNQHRRRHPDEAALPDLAESVACMIRVKKEEQRRKEEEERKKTPEARFVAWAAGEAGRIVSLFLVFFMPAYWAFVLCIVGWFSTGWSLLVRFSLPGISIVSFFFAHFLLLLSAVSRVS